MVKALFTSLWAAVLLISCAKKSDLNEIEKIRSERYAHLGTPEMQLLPADNELSQKTKGANPPWLNWVLNSWLGWSPMGRSLMQSQNCEDLARHWSDFESLDDYFRSCEEILKNDSIFSYFQGLRTMTIRLSPEHHPFLQRVVFHLPDGVRLKAYLALKDTQKKRPLVILRLGLFAHIEQFQNERFLFTQMFEQSPFNMLIVENTSGTDFIKNNTRLSVGGFEEALQNQWLAQLLTRQDQPLSRLISHLHLMGMSLGGHGVLLNSFYNPLNENRFASLMAFCPAVQFEKSMEVFSRQGGWMAWAGDFWARARLAELNGALENFKTDGDLNYIEKAVAYVRSQYKGSVNYGSSIHWPSGLVDSKDLRSNNQFLEKELRDYKLATSNVLIFANLQDRFVPYELNSGWLKQQQQTEHRFANFHIQTLKYGNHCSFPDAYQWKPMAFLAQNYVLQKSPNFERQRVVIRPLPEKSFFKKENLQAQPESQNTDSNDKDIEILTQMRERFFIQWNSDQRVFFVQLQYFDQDHPRSQSYAVSLKDLDFDFPDHELSETEIEMAERWLYHNMQMAVSRKNRSESVSLTWMKAK